MAVVDTLKAIADLKAAGMPEQQARAFVRVIEQARGAGDNRCGEGGVSRVALQDDIRQLGLEVSRTIDAESRFYVACLIGMFAAMYALLRLIP